jgi:hypothetical protein
MNALLFSNYGFNIKLTITGVRYPFRIHKIILDTSIARALGKDHLDARARFLTQKAKKGMFVRCILK